MKVNEILRANRIVIKVGTSTLTHDTGKLNLKRMEKLAETISDLHNSGKELILVSSGAQSAGISKLGLSCRPATREGKQATAAVGQCELMNMYGRFFALFGKTVAQVLMTKFVLDNPVQRENAKNTFNELIKIGCIPIVNENDVISYEGIDFGGNDILASYVAIVADADAVINLSDIDGLYDCDPRTNADAKLIEYVERIDDKILAYAGGAGTSRGTGGMVAKLGSAKILTRQGISMVIANGSDPRILYDIIQSGDFRGTFFSGGKSNG